MKNVGVVLPRVTEFFGEIFDFIHCLWWSMTGNNGRKEFGDGKIPQRAFIEKSAMIAKMTLSVFALPLRSSRLCVKIAEI
jgi:hypothetical protein